jgi:hypothetical protein
VTMSRGPESGHARREGTRQDRAGQDGAGQSGEGDH